MHEIGPGGADGRVAPSLMPAPPDPGFFPQPDYRPGAPLYFLHVPKCAGTTVRTTLESLFDGDRVFPSGSPVSKGHYASFQRIRDAGEDLAGYEMVSGHLGELIFDRLRPETNVFTWLREPRDRTLSSFFFFIAGGHSKYYREYTDRVRSGERLETVFMDWLRDVPEGATRYQIEIVAGHLRTGYPPWLERHPDGNLTGAVLDILRRCFFIGLLEDNDRSMDAVCALTGALPPNPGVRRNVGRLRQSGLALSPAEQDEFDRILAPDVELYGQVRDIYDQQMASLAARAAERPEFGLIGDREALREYLVRRPGAPTHRPLSVWKAWDAGHVDNLDSREQHTDAEGRLHRWRWSGPGLDTRLFVHLPRDEERLLRIALDSATPREHAAATTLFLSEQAVPVVLSDAPGGGFHLTAALGPDMLASLPDVVEIRLHTPRYLDEDTLGDRVGSRLLGVALAEISLLPKDAAVPVAAAEAPTPAREPPVGEAEGHPPGRRFGRVLRLVRRTGGKLLRALGLR